MNKKFTNLLVLLGGIALTTSGASDVATLHSYEGDVAVKNLAGETIEWPAVGTTDPASCMSSIWNGSAFGFKRLDDRRVAVTGTSGWGYRCDYGATRFNRDRFEVSLDLTDFTRGDCLGLSFGAQGIYNGEAGQLLCIDIVKYSFDDRNDYMICLNTGCASGNNHNDNIDGWSDGSETWLDSYAGAVVSAPDHVLTIGWTIEGENVEVYANDYSVTFPVDELFVNLTGDFCVNFCSGYQAGERHFIVNYCVDGDDMEYYDEVNGTYYKVKQQVTNFVETCESAVLNNVEDFINIYSLTEDVELDTLYSHDEVYLRRSYDPALNKLQEDAVTSFGNSTYIELLRYYVNQLHTLTSNLDDEATLLEAVSKVDMINRIKETIDTLSLSSEEESEINTILTTFDADNASVQEAASSIYSDIVNNVITLMNAAQTLEEVRSAEVAYNTISTTFRNYMPAEELEVLEGQLQTARDAFVAKFGSVSEESGFVSGDRIRVVEGEENIGFTAWGSSSTGGELASGLLYKREKLDVIDLTVNYTVEHFGEYVINIMANPTFFSAADDPSIQNYKGFVFIVRDMNGTQASVQPYLIDGTCNRFFDGQLSQTDLIIPREGDIEFKMSVEQVNTSGIIENYLVFSFNGIKYETPLVREFEVLGALEDGKGYFGIGSQNGVTENPLAITLNKINNNNVTADSLVNENIQYSPVIYGEDLTHTIGETNNLVIGIDPRLETGLKFYMDGELLTSGDHYTYQRNTTLTLKATYLNTLTAGEHTLKIESNKGITEVKITIQNADVGGGDETSTPTTGPGTSISTPDTTPDNPTTPEENNVGVIVGATIGGIVAAAIIALGVVYLVKKRKK